MSVNKKKTSPSLMVMKRSLQPAMKKIKKVKRIFSTPKRLRRSLSKKSLRLNLSLSMIWQMKARPQTLLKQKSRRMKFNKKKLRLRIK